MPLRAQLAWRSLTMSFHNFLKRTHGNLDWSPSLLLVLMDFTKLDRQSVTTPSPGRWTFHLGPWL